MCSAGSQVNHTLKELLQNGVPGHTVLLEGLRDVESPNVEWKSCHQTQDCLLYTSDAADEEDSVDLGGRRIIKKKNINIRRGGQRVVASMISIVNKSKTT
eukprot:TRINITY_DN10090_c0_g2_i1.p1 TRINITY_DN10090_c0_g2~~TRINITY_DN10090_c0_g2_i1.p1  ORF type:complete len:100 (-),score=15.66 TRINITY_DN10090_c0_g2_i1:52-351(-)